MISKLQNPNGKCCVFHSIHVLFFFSLLFFYFYFFYFLLFFFLMSFLFLISFFFSNFFSLLILIKQSQMHLVALLMVAPNHMNQQKVIDYFSKLVTTLCSIIWK